MLVPGVLNRLPLKNADIGGLRPWGHLHTVCFVSLTFIFMCLSISLLSGCGEQQEDVKEEKPAVSEAEAVLEELALSVDTSQTYTINDLVDIVIETSTEDMEIPESAFRTFEETLECNDGKAAFTSFAAGEFEIYTEHLKLTSNKIRLKFVNQEAERIATEQAEAARVTAELAETERITQEQAAQQQNVGRSVWISTSVSKYHSI